MSALRIAKRYAKSLLDLAVEKNVLDQTWNDIQYFQKTLESRDFFLLIKSPIIKGSKKRSIFSKLFDGQISKMTKSFFEIIIRKGREKFLPEIAEAFENQYMDYKEISTVTLKTAVPLDVAAEKTIRQKLIESLETKSNIDLKMEVDPSLIGGFTIVFEDKQYDSSIAYKLEQMRKQFSTN